MKKETSFLDRVRSSLSKKAQKKAAAMTKKILADIRKKKKQ